MAIGLIKLYDRNTRDSISDVLIIRYIPLFRMDCLELAVHCKCKGFLSTTIVQNILNNIWSGKQQNNSELVGLNFLFLEFPRKKILQIAALIY
jgi:hypothetical protein